jgi:predicted molibdopterin-dependent oxidoreductase YjgC
MAGIRRLNNVVRGAELTIMVDGQPISAFAGETVLAAMLAADRIQMRQDSAGVPRGAFCNMGTCSECLVKIIEANGAIRRARACLTPVAAHMQIAT